MARSCDFAIISDCHLGTAACRVEALLAYLHDIKPKHLIINGDLCDLGKYFRRHWPATHLAVFARLMEFVHDGTEVTYIIGNHDEVLRKRGTLRLPGVHMADEIEIEVDGKRLLVTHGDCLDCEVSCAPLLRTLGSVGYSGLMKLDGGMQCARGLCGFAKSEFSVATAIKHRIPGAAGHIQRFEQAAVELAHSRGYDGILVGHIHQPVMREQQVAGRSISYLNSGDWVEHNTALECTDGEWQLIQAPRSAAAFTVPAAAGAPATA